MTGRTSASHARHDTRASSTTKRRRKGARTQQHHAAGAPKSLTKAESSAQAEYSARDRAETEPWNESDYDSTLDRTSNELGDIERPGESDQDREDSDIERTH